MDRRSLPPSGPLDLVDEIPLGDDEKAYVAAARAANTLKGYRSDWAEWCSWCTREGLDPLAGEAAAISRYLVFLAGVGAKVGTMARRLSAMRFAFRMRGLPDPTGAARVVAVWEGIRRTHGAPADQSAPLMPPELLDVLEACPVAKTWATPGRASEPDLAGARDRALLLVGFVGALRRSELVALDWEDVNDHPQGLVVTIPRSKTNQEGTEPEFVVLPIGPEPGPLPCAGPALLGRACRHQLRSGLPARLHRQQGRGPPTRREQRQLPGASGRKACRHRASPLLGPLAAGRFRHLRPPAGGQRPGHRPPDPPPLPSHVGAVREDP